MGLLDASLMPSIRALGYTERLESDSGMQSQSSAAWGGSPLRGEGIRPYEPAQAGSQDGVGGHQGHGPAPQAELTEGASIEHPQTWGARAARAGVFKAKSKQTLLAHKAQGAFMDEARRAQEGKARMQELER